MLLIGVAVYPFMAALSLFWWPALRARLAPTGMSDRRAAGTLLAAHLVVFAGGLVALTATSWSRPECAVSLFSGSAAGTYLGIGWRLDSFRLLWLGGVVPLLGVGVPFVVRDVQTSLSGKQALRTTRWALVLAGLLFQLGTADGTVAPLVVWTLLPVVVRGLARFPRGGAQDETRAMTVSVTAQLLAVLPLGLALSWVGRHAHSTAEGAVRDALASSTTLAATWVGILTLVSLLWRVSTMTLTADARKIFAGSPAGRAAVEVLLPWADLYLALRYIVGLLPVMALRQLAAAQLTLGTLVCVAVALALAAAPPARRRELAPLHVLALWGVALIMTAGKSSVAWAGAAAYLFNYCLLASAAYTTPPTVTGRRGRALLFALTLAGATALPHCLSGQMLVRVGEDLLLAFGWWSLALLGLGVATLAATHVVTGRQGTIPSGAVVAASWGVALALGLLAPNAVRSWLTQAFGVFGLSPRW